MRQIKRSLGQHVENILRKKIILLEYKEGEHLKEVQLAEEFNISRGPVRDAIKKLELEGLVTTSSSGRTVVSKFDLTYIEHIYHFRILLETYAVKQLVVEIISQDREGLQRIVGQMRNHILENKDYLQDDFNLHYTIVKMSKNPMLIQSWLALKDLFMTLIEVTSEATKQRNEAIFLEHERIVTAIIEGNVNDASNLLETHLLNAKNYYSAAVFKRLNEEETKKHE